MSPASAGPFPEAPLGFVSLTENLMMIAMAVWMAAAFVLPDVIRHP